MRACALPVWSLDGKWIVFNDWFLDLGRTPDAVRKGMLVLHLFSGHRRAGDLQCWLENEGRARGLELVVLSVDLAVDEQGDLTDKLIRNCGTT